MSYLSGYRSLDDLPATIPIFPLDGALLLPRGQLPLNIFEPRYLEMIDYAMSGDRVIGMIQTDSGASAGEPPAIVRTGCAGRLTSYSETPDNRYLITLTGICRFKMNRELDVSTPFRQVEPDFSVFEADLLEDSTEANVDRNRLLKTFKSYLDANGMETDWEEISSVSNEMLVNALSMMSPFSAHDKQALLEAPNLQARAEVLIALTEMDLAARATPAGQRLQ